MIATKTARCLALALGLLGVLPIVEGRATETLRVAKTINVLWALVPVDIGVQQGIFAQDGLDVQITTLAGDPKVIQGFVGGNFDLALASGTSMIFATKGAPVRGIAALNGAPRNFSLLVGMDSPVKSVADIKGKNLGTATLASFPEFLARRISVTQGWGPDGVHTIVTGDAQASIAAMRVGQSDGMVGATELGYQLEELHQGRIVVGLEKFVPHVHTHVVLGREDFIRDHADLTQRFLKGIFQSIAFMKANRERTIEISASVMHMSPAVIARTYDYEISMMSPDGAFDPAAIQVLKDAFVEMGLLTAPPSDDQLLTTQFVPVKF